MPLFSRKGGAKGTPTRLFYACDIHGSEPTYRKFLNAAKFYEVDALVFGGDLMGKLLIPMVREAGGTWRASLQGQQHHIKSEEQLKDFKRTMQTLGFYWQEMDPEEYASYEGQQDRIDDLFDVLAKQRLAEWVTLAEDRLAGLGRDRVPLRGERRHGRGPECSRRGLWRAGGERREPRRAARRRARAAHDRVLDPDAVGDAARANGGGDRRGDREADAVGVRSREDRIQLPLPSARLESRHMPETRRLGLASYAGDRARSARLLRSRIAGGCRCAHQLSAHGGTPRTHPRVPGSDEVRPHAPPSTPGASTERGCCEV